MPNLLLFLHIHWGGKGGACHWGHGAEAGQGRHRCEVGISDYNSQPSAYRNSKQPAPCTNKVISKIKTPGSPGPCRLPLSSILSLGLVAQREMRTVPGRAAPAQHPLPIADCSRPTDSRLGVGPCSALIHFPVAAPRDPLSRDQTLPPAPCSAAWGPGALLSHIHADLLTSAPLCPRAPWGHFSGEDPPLLDSPRSWWCLGTMRMGVPRPPGMASAPASPPVLLPLLLRGGEQPLCRPSPDPGLLTVSRDPWPRCLLPAGAPPYSVVSHSSFSPRPSLTQRGLGRLSRLTALSGELAPLCVVIKMRKPSPERSGNLPQSLSKAGPRPGQAGPGLSAQLGLDRAPPEAAALEKWLPTADNARDV